MRSVSCICGVFSLIPLTKHAQQVHRAKASSPFTFPVYTHTCPRSDEVNITRSSERNEKSIPYHKPGVRALLPLGLEARSVYIEGLDNKDRSMEASFGASRD